VGVRDFRELKVWHKSHGLTLAVYQITKGFPRDELYGLTSQIRRAAASIPANIAEGCGRLGDAEFHRFLQISLGSANELEYHLLLSKDLDYLATEKHLELHTQLIEIKRMLVSLTQKIRNEKAIR
jgi:four helix bundle protein